MNLLEQLMKYAKSGSYPFHMPGHKRNVVWLQQHGFFSSNFSPYQFDITEIDGFDNLHNPQGILKEGMKQAAKLYGAEDTFYLVNGSSVGLLASIMAMTNRGDKVIVARNCHKAVYHGIYLNNLTPVYCYPLLYEKLGITIGIRKKDVDDLLKIHKEAKLIILTSPTYEGFTSDIRGICETAHKYHIPVLVDEAHGSHLAFSEKFPESAVGSYADVVVQSLHKTLPSFTQTALLHCKGELAPRDKIKKYLSIFQTSSPSYLFMAGMDCCIRMLKREGKQVFTEYENNLDTFYKETRKLQHIQVMGKKDWADLYDGLDWDYSKLILSVKGTSMTGSMLYDILRKKYKLQMEMVSKDYVLGMTSICDQKVGFERLQKALFEVDKLVNVVNSYDTKEVKYKKNKKGLKSVYSIFETDNKNGINIPLNKAAGRILKEYIYLYPPGVPLGVPGEQIDEVFWKQIIQYLESGLLVTGVSEDGWIRVIEEG